LRRFWADLGLKSAIIANSADVILKSGEIVDLRLKLGKIANFVFKSGKVADLTIKLGNLSVFRICPDLKRFG